MIGNYLTQDFYFQLLPRSFRTCILHRILLRRSNQG